MIKHIARFAPKKWKVMYLFCQKKNSIAKDQFERVAEIKKRSFKNNTENIQLNEHIEIAFEDVLQNDVAQNQVKHKKKILLQQSSNTNQQKKPFFKNQIKLQPENQQLDEYDFQQIEIQQQQEKFKKIEKKSSEPFFKKRNVIMKEKQERQSLNQNKQLPSKFFTKQLIKEQKKVFTIKQQNQDRQLKFVPSTKFFKKPLIQHSQPLKPVVQQPRQVNLINKQPPKPFFTNLPPKTVQIPSQPQQTIPPPQPKKPVIDSRTPFFNRQTLIQAITFPQKQSSVSTMEQPKSELQFHSSTTKSIVDNINRVNDYFMGIKLNTNYLKTTNQVSYSELLSMKQSVTLQDLPFSLSAEQVPAAVDLSSTRIYQILFARNSYTRLLTHLKHLAKTYFVSIATSTRTCPLQPNFQKDIIVTLHNLKQKYTLQYTPTYTQPQLEITNISIFKGLSVNRNDNYSEDSYRRGEIEPNFIQYSLNKLENEELMETEWRSTMNMNVRFETTVWDAPTITVIEGEQVVGSNAGVKHRIVFQCDMVRPPLNADNVLTQEEMLKAYRIRTNNIKITNVDMRNKYYQLTYSEEEKKKQLINSIA